MSLLDLASLVLAPTATKEGKVYSAIPDTGDGDMTFSRGSAATRVNSEGLIEKERGNLLLQSNTFDTTWTQIRADYTSGQTGYDGSSDAWQVECNAVGYSGGYQNTSSLNEVNCSSLYAKAGNVDYLFITTTQGSTNNAQYFNLTNGTLGSLVGTGIINANIESVGNGWYRCSITMSPNASFGYFLFGLSDTDGNASGAIGEYIYIQDAMLNEGLVAQPYIPTTTTAVYEGITDDVPRVNYSGGGCPSLKLEPQRSNLFPQSEYFGSGGWVISNGTLTTNYAISPEGVQNAAKINFTSGGEIVRTTSFTAGQQYTFSFYAKVESGTFDFTYGNMDYSSISGTATTDWQRFEITQTVPVATRYPKIDATDMGDLLIYGMQCELGSYSTSYIPTYGTSTTRVADSCSKTGISSLIGQTEGTMFVEFASLSNDVTSNYFSISDGTYNNRASILFSTGTNVLRSFLRVSGVAQSDITTTSYDITKNNRVAFAYSANDFVMYVNGTLINSDTSGSTFAADTLSTISFSEIGTSAAALEGEVSQAILFPTRLTNDQLEELTK